MKKTTIIHFTNTFDAKKYFYSIILEGNIISPILEDEDCSIEYLDNTFLVENMQSHIELFFSNSENQDIKAIVNEYGKHQFGWYDIPGIYNLDILISVETSLINHLLLDWELFFLKFFPDITITNIQQTADHILKQRIFLGNTKTISTS